MAERSCGGCRLRRAGGRRARLAGRRVESRERVAEERRPREVQRARAALAAAGAELEALAARLDAGGRGEDAEILATGVLMAEDPALLADVERAVRDGARRCGRARGRVRAPRRRDRDARRPDARRPRRRRPRARPPRRPPGRAGGGRRATSRAGPASAGVLVAATWGRRTSPAGRRRRAIALVAGAPTAHAAIVARGLGLPMAVGLGPGCLTAAADEPMVVDGESG